MKSKSIEYFEQLAERYDSWFDRHKAVFQSELEALKRVIPKAGEGLEVGVGSGRFATALGIQTGVDPSRKFCSIAKSRGINAIEGVAESLPFQTEQFDFVFFGTLLCFLDYPIAALAEAKRVLKHDGTLIIAMIDRASALGQSYVARKDENPFYRYAHFYSVDEVFKLMSQVGFVQKEVYQTIFLPLNDIHSQEPVKSGYGEGGYVVIRAIDALHGFDADVP